VRLRDWHATECYACPRHQSQERRESIRQTWMRLTLQQHANVDVRFVLGQPDIVDGAGLGTGGLLGETAFSQAHSLLLVRPVVLNVRCMPAEVWKYLVPVPLWYIGMLMSTSASYCSPVHDMLLRKLPAAE